jgi:hypothetical protein
MLNRFGPCFKGSIRTSKSSKTTPVAFGFASFIFHALLTGCGGGAGKSLMLKSLSASSAHELVFCIFGIKQLFGGGTEGSVFTLFSDVRTPGVDNNQPIGSAGCISFATNMPDLSSGA